ncbi:MAG: hypothetical protein WBD71_10165 [Xanthobacteraceae bacterium]
MALRVELDPHARERAPERGASEAEIISTVSTGERFPAKFGRVGFRRNFAFDGIWRGRRYATKQVEAYAVERPDHWLVVTVITKYF